MLRHGRSGALFRLGMGFPALLGSAGCTATPPPASSIAAADPSAPVPATRYRSVTPVAVTMAPAEPKPWQDLNRNVAPRAAESQGPEP